MVDDIVTPAADTVAITAASPAEVAASSTQNSAPLPENVPASPVEASAPVGVKTPDPVKSEIPVEAPKVETLLGGDKKAEEKPIEPKVEPKLEEKPAEVKADEPLPVPVYESFNLPEGVTVDDAKISEFTKSLADFEITTKASHEEVQKLGQQLVERHIAEVKNTIDRYTKSLTESWNKQKNDWKDSFLKDPEFANRTDTVVNSAIDAIGIYGGNAKQQEEFRSLMETSGVGNHPAMIRLLSNVVLAKAEPKPLAAPQIAPKANASKIQKMYGKKTG